MSVRLQSHLCVSTDLHQHIARIASVTLCSRFGLCRRSRLAIDAYTHTQYWSIYLPTYVRACIYVYVANTNPKPVCQALANDRHDDEVVDRCLLGFCFWCA